MLDKLKDLICDNKLNLCSIKKEIDMINESNNCQDKYLKDLLDPINRRNVKIPSKNPVPTVAFQMKTCSDVTLNEEGEAFISVCPFFLCDDSFYGKVIGYSIFDEEKEGYEWFTYICKTLSASYHYDARPVEFLKDAFNLSMAVEEGIYVKYRLVSAALKVIYIGTVGSSSGTISGAISLQADKNMMVHTFGNIRTGVFPPGDDMFYPASDVKPKDIEYMRYMPSFKERKCLEGITMLYYPVDNSYYQFYDLMTYYDVNYSGIAQKGRWNNDYFPILYGNKDKCRSNFKWLIHVEHGQPMSKSIRLELYCNFECIPSPKVLNYMPVSINTCFLTDEILREIINKVKDYINKNII